MAYITLDKQVAKKIIWRPMLDVNRERKLGLIEHNQEMRFSFPNGSNLYFFSAKDNSDIHKVLGNKYYYVAVDECQKIKDSILEELITRNLYAALMDQGGYLDICGTPPPSDTGYFLELCDSKGFKTYNLQAARNPFLLEESGMDYEKMVDGLLELSGLTRDHPTVLREFYGIRIKDSHALVYAFDRNINLGFRPEIDEQWFFVAGIDLGYEDHDAIVVWAFTKHDPTLYQVFEYKKEKQDISALADRVKFLQNQFPIYKIIIDQGALGKKIAEEMRIRHGIVMEAAQKSEKLSYIELMNSDLRKGHIKLLPQSMYQEEIELLTWDRTGAKPIEDPRQENHLCDAGLYAWREARHFTAKPKEEITENYQDSNLWAKDALKRAQERVKKRHSGEWWQTVA